MTEKKVRGFATLTPEQRREISRKGGMSAHAQGKGHQWKAGSEEAREAGRKGGSATATKRRPTAE